MNLIGRMLVVDSTSIIRVGLVSLLKREAPEASVEEAGTVDEALSASRRGPWELIVIDPVFEQEDGVALLRQLRADNPATPILVFTAASESHLGVATMLAGANGFIRKTASVEELLRALDGLIAGNEHASAALRQRVGESRSPFGRLRGFAALSEAERRVLRELGEGRTAKEIAVASGVSASTIGTYRTRILAKLGLTTTAELVRYVVEHKLHAA